MLETKSAMDFIWWKLAWCETFISAQMKFDIRTMKTKREKKPSAGEKVARKHSIPTASSAPSKTRKTVLNRQARHFPRINPGPVQHNFSQPTSSTPQSHAGDPAQHFQSWKVDILTYPMAATIHSHPRLKSRSSSVVHSLR